MDSTKNHPQIGGGKNCYEKDVGYNNPRSNLRNILLYSYKYGKDFNEISRPLQEAKKSQ